MKPFTGEVVKVCTGPARRGPGQARGSVTLLTLFDKNGKFRYLTLNSTAAIGLDPRRDAGPKTRRATHIAKASPAYRSRRVQALAAGSDAR